MSGPSAGFGPTASEDKQRPPTPTLADDNPYLSSHALTALEAEVLGEYARMAKTLERLTSVTNKLAGAQPEVLTQLGPLERKLGLVLTLFKASVWATYVAQEQQAEEYEDGHYR